MNLCKKRREAGDDESITGVSVVSRSSKGTAVQALIFDLDGVIVDSERNHFAAFNQALAPYGFGLDFDYFTSRMIGISPRESLARLRDEFDLAFDIATVAACKDRSYQAIAAKNPRANTLVIDLVHRLKKHFPIALASGAPAGDVSVILKTLNLSGLFDVLVSGDDVSRGKPDPEIFLLAAKRLSRPPQFCVVFEDSVPGLEAAHRAGMRVIAIRSEYASGLYFPQVNFVIESVKSLDAGKLEALLLKEQL